MSLGEADAKFPNQGGSGLPPSPSRENPGQVYPKSDPSPGPTPAKPPQSVMDHVGNPFLMSNALSKLDHALNGVIEILENEKRASAGSETGEDPLLATFRTWRSELTAIVTDRGGTGQSVNKAPPVTDTTAEGGGMFTD